MQMDVTAYTPTRVIFSGKAGSVILPGEQGVFEILPHHKPILSRLISGTLHIGEESFSVQRGVVKVDKNSVTIIVEEKL